MAKPVPGDVGGYLPAPPFAKELASWGVTLSAVAQYGLHRLHLAQCPDLWKRADYIMTVIGRVLHYSDRVFVRGAEHCPKAPPAVFAGNHLMADDPFLMFPAIVHASGGAVRPRIMMRDDFFGKLPGWMSKLVDMDEVLVSLAVFQISRGNVTFSQLKPFLALLREPGSFMIYPGRSRSRTGVFFEYRDDVQEPGSVGFFLAHAQSNRPDLNVAAVPMARTYNPVNKRSVIAFGPSLYLPHETGGALKPSERRAAQRALDTDLIVAMGNLVEINAPQLVSSILCLRAIRQRPNEMTVARLCEQVEAVVRTLATRYLVDPALTIDAAGETRAALAYLADAGMLAAKTDRLELNPTAALVPEPDSSYRRLNPLRYLSNQVLHLRDVVALADDAARD